MRTLIAVSFLFLAGCENPQLGIGATISPGGNVSVSPTVSGQVGDVGVAVSG
ncbi:MAG: hypothetical protein ABJF50_09960 [Paracoccaceae bacterium]